MFKYVTIIMVLTVTVQCKFKLILLHNNDIHGRYEETEKDGKPCKPEHRNKSCIGGFARTAHLIRKYRKEAEDGVGPPVIFLSAGDIFTGTRWDGIHKWNIASAFMNILKPDVQCLGNHEFDRGVNDLSKFVDECQFPTIAGNADFSKEPNLAHKIQKSKILTINGTRIGVIGHITRSTQNSSLVGKTIFSDEIETVKKESKRLSSPINNVKILIVLGHSGFDKDKEIAEKVPRVDVVVGAHSHSFLWTGEIPDYAINDRWDGEYPTFITVNVTRNGKRTKKKKRIPVIQAYAFTKYLGKLDLTFDDEGNLLKCSGNPIYLDSSIPQENDVLKLLERYRPAVDELDRTIVGTSMVNLTLRGRTCRNMECNYGNVITDSYVLYKASVSPKHWNEAPIGLMNAGSIINNKRTILNLGVNRTVTKGAVFDTLPFGNPVVSLKLKGSDLVKTLEQGVRGGQTTRGEFLQVSGLQVVYDESNPPMSRVVSVKIRCGICGVPSYSYINPEETYSIVTTDNLAHGLDGHSILKEKSFDKRYENITYLDTVIWYFQTFGPVYAEIEGRITFADQIRRDLSNSVLFRPTQFTLLVLLASLILQF